MKKLLSTLLIMVFSFVLFPLSALGASTDESSLSLQLMALPMEEIIDYIKNHDVDVNTLRDALIDRELSSYQDDKEFSKHYAEDPTSAMEMIQGIVDNQLALIHEETGVIPKVGNSTNAWIDPVLIKQKNNYYCGPCSALQAITAYGGYVDGNTNNEKQDTLANAMGTSSTVGTLVYKVRNVLNTYISGYSYKRGSAMSNYTFRQTVLNSLVNNITNKIRLSDCNRNPAYYGTRSIPTSEAKASVSAAERYLISTSLI